jgi:hypothetical protein
MDNPLYELKNSSDLFKKAKWNFSKMDEQVNSYDLFDCLCTMNHIPDWIKNDPNSRKDFSRKPPIAAGVTRRDT